MFRWSSVGGDCSMEAQDLLVMASDWSHAGSGKESVSVRELGSTLKIRSSKRSVPVVSASARSRELWKDSDPTREVRASVMER